MFAWCRRTARALPQADGCCLNVLVFRFGQITDGEGELVLLFASHSVRHGRQHRSARDFANCRDIGQSNYPRLFESRVLNLGIRLLFANVTRRRRAARRSIRMLRIERSSNGQVVFTLSGRMQTEDIEQFQQLLVVETPGQALRFDLRDVTLVNQEAVGFLAECEAKGIRLESCPLHIRNWIDQEKRRNKRRRRPKKDTI
jgi:hypothetical protein